MENEQTEQELFSDLLKIVQEEIKEVVDNPYELKKSIISCVRGRGYSVEDTYIIRGRTPTIEFKFSGERIGKNKIVDDFYR